MPTVSNKVNIMQDCWYYNRNSVPVVYNTLSRYKALAPLVDTSKTFQNNLEWHIKLAKGLDAGSNYTRQWYSVVEPVEILAYSETQSGFSYFVSQDRMLWLNDGYWPSGSMPVHIPTRDKALTSLKQKLRQNIGQSQLAAPLAESKELHKLVRQSSSLATDMIKALIDIKRTKGMSALKFASDVWLGFNFGIAPIIKDTNAAVASIQDFLDKDDRSVRLMGSAKFDYVSRVDNPTGYTSCWGTQLKFSHSIHHELAYRYISSYDLALRAGENYGIPDHFGLGFSDLIPLFWELVPYSWVADYFGTMGAFLEDTFWSPPGNSKYLCFNSRYTATDIITPRQIKDNAKLATLHYKPGRVVYKIFDRTMLTSLPHISLRVKTLDEMGLRSVSKLLNLSSVLIKRSR